MRKAILAVSVAALICGSFAIKGRADTAPANTVTTGVGFNCTPASTSDRKKVFGDLVRAHVAWTRIFVPWNAVQPPDPNNSRVPEYPGGYDPANIAKVAACVQLAKQLGLRVLIVFLSDPAWVAKHWNTPPAPPVYAAALSGLVRLFPQVNAWEVLNEENWKFFFKGTARAYTRILCAAYKAVKQVNPHALVVYGGLRRNDARWVEQTYKAGARGCFNVLATHPYPRIYKSGKLGRIIGPAQKVRDVMVENGDEDVPMWFTEFGWSRHDVSARRQARLLYRAYEYTAANQPYVQVAFWYEAKTEDIPPPNPWLPGVALIKPKGKTTPAYHALARYGRDASAGVAGYPSGATSAKGSGGYAHEPPGRSG